MGFITLGGNKQKRQFLPMNEGGTIHNVTLENVSIKTSGTKDVLVAPKGAVAAVVRNGKMTDCSVK